LSTRFSPQASSAVEGTTN